MYLLPHVRWNPAPGAGPPAHGSLMAEVESSGWGSVLQPCGWATRCPVLGPCHVWAHRAGWPRFTWWSSIPSMPGRRLRERPLIGDPGAGLFSGASWALRVLDIVLGPYPQSRGPWMSPEMALSPGRSLGTTLDCPVLRYTEAPLGSPLQPGFHPQTCSPRGLPAHLAASPLGSQACDMAHLTNPLEDPGPPTLPPSVKALGRTVCVSPGFEVSLLALFLCSRSPAALVLSHSLCFRGFPGFLHSL